MNITQPTAPAAEVPSKGVGCGELVSCRELTPGDTIERYGKRLVYHGYGTRRGSKLWQLQLTHAGGGGLVLLHLFPSDTVSRVKAANTAVSQPGTQLRAHGVTVTFSK